MNTFIEPPAGLLQKILKRIHKEERLLVFRKVILFSITLSLSALGFVPALRLLISDFNTSGFFHFLPLIFSDFSVVIAYWQNFTMILLETLPAISLALFLAVLLTIFQSIKSLAKNIKIIANNGRLATN